MANNTDKVSALLEFSFLAAQRQIGSKARVY